MNKSKKLVGILLTTTLLTIGSSFAALAATGWQQEGNNWQYYDRDGYAVTDEWRKAGNEQYYLGDNGNMVVSDLIEDGNSYYYVDASGKKVTNVWKHITDEDSDSYWYYFQNNGKAKESGWLTIDGQKYHFTDFKMDEKWLQIDNSTYYLNDKHDGTFGSVKTGWVYVDDFDDEDEVDADEDGWYYFQSSGKMITSEEKKINGHYYVFDEKGLMLDNWVEFTSSTATSSDAASSLYKYYNPSLGNRINGWLYLDDMSDDEGRETEEGWYYFKNGIAYSADYKTTKVADGYGVAKINNKIYCFDDTGKMITGKVDGESGTYYYFDTDGAMKYGKVKITDDDDLDEGTYFFSDKGNLGEKGQAETGIVKGYLYDNGELVTAEDGMKYEVVTVDGKDYLVNESGKVKTSGVVKDGDGTKWTITKDAEGNYIITKG